MFSIFFVLLSVCFSFVLTESKTPNTFTGSTHLPWCNNYEFKYHFYLYTESKMSYPLTDNTCLPASFSFPSSGSIVTPIPTVTQSKYEHYELN